jgi:hypothetical protein
LSAEDKPQVKLAFTKCEDAAKELKSTLERIKIDGVPATTAFEKMKAVGRKAAYPFRKATIEDLAEDVESCQDALHVAMSVLQLNIGATTVEQLQKLDDKLVASTTAIESGLRDLGLAHDAAKDEIVQHLRRGQSKEGNGYRGKLEVPSDERPRVTGPCCRRFDFGRPVHWRRVQTSSSNPESVGIPGRKFWSFLDPGQTCLWQINTHEVSSEPEPWSTQAVEIRRSQRCHLCKSFLLDRRVNNTKFTARTAAVATVSSLAGGLDPCSYFLSFAMEVYL